MGRDNSNGECRGTRLGYVTYRIVESRTFISLVSFSLVTHSLDFPICITLHYIISIFTGIFEGRTLSLLHPTMMVSMLTFSIWTATLGFAWRRQRTMGDEISTLKKTLPDLQGAASVSAALAATKSAESVDAGRVSLLQSAVATETKIAELVLERKELAAANPKDQHFSQGALLAFLGTAFAIEGPLNTYARAGKLFPGPHLYAGAGLVVLWGLAVACVPAMQKGNDTARIVHIGANAAGMGLFGWQVVSGWPILLKVIEKTNWP
jgi:hypothetical protein